MGMQLSKPQPIDILGLLNNHKNIQNNQQSCSSADDRQPMGQIISGANQGRVCGDGKDPANRSNTLIGSNSPAASAVGSAVKGGQNGKTFQYNKHYPVFRKGEKITITQQDVLDAERLRRLDDLWTLYHDRRISKMEYKRLQSKIIKGESVVSDLRHLLVVSSSRKFGLRDVSVCLTDNELRARQQIVDQLLGKSPRLVTAAPASFSQSSGNVASEDCREE